MYKGDNIRRVDSETFEIKMPADRAFKILQLTDLHLGFGILSKKNDKKAQEAVTTLMERTQPDMVVFTGDTVFPYIPKTGTLNNKKQARIFMEFMDMFKTPYAFVMGNHDTEMGSRLNRRQLGNEFKRGEYAIFADGPDEIFGVGNYFINLISPDKWELGAKAAANFKGARRTTVKQHKEYSEDEPHDYISDTPMALTFLDSNMYGDGWFFSGFDRIHADQTEWCMNRLAELKMINPQVKALAFFHMPLKEFKDAYEKMKLGDTSIQYHFGGIGEKEDYFGISRFKGDFFERAYANNTIRGMFCGHDHLNSLSLTYKGIRMTYGMSIDYNGYKGISKKQIQRGGTLITVNADGTFNVRPEPLTRVVSPRIRGMKELAEKAMDEMTKQADASRARMREMEAERKKRREEAEALRKARREAVRARVKQINDSLKKK